MTEISREGRLRTFIHDKRAPTVAIKGHRTRLISSVKGDFDVCRPPVHLLEPERRHVTPVPKSGEDGQPGLCLSQIRGVIIDAEGQHLLTPVAC